MRSEKSQRVRVSKNKKKNWNKYCKVKDIEDFLEEKRTEERLGGPVSEKRDEELFFISTERDNEVPRSKKSKSLNELRCYLSLNSCSSIPPPVKPLKGEAKRSSDDDLPKILRKKLKNKTKGPQESSHAGYDLWAEEKDKAIDPELQELAMYRDEITKKRPVKVPCYRYQKPSLLPAVEVPHPGASYNPSYQDHQDLLREAVQVEEKKLKQELHLKRVLTDMFPKKSEAPTEETWLKEMSAGLEDGKDEDYEDRNPYLVGNPPVTDDDRKSKRQKRKKMELKKQERDRLKEKMLKKEMHEIYRLRSIAAEIKQAEKLSADRQKRREQREVEKLYKPRTLSQYKFEPNDLEVNLSEELRGSLRAVKVEGNLFEDRYKSLQKRNIIEPRIKQKRKRKYKLKVQIKRSHRNFE